MLRKQQAEFESKLCQAEKKRKELEDTSKCLELEKALLKKEIQVSLKHEYHAIYIFHVIGFR